MLLRCKCSLVPLWCSGVCHGTESGGKPDRRRIVERLRDLAEMPRPQGCEKLSGYADRYRVRQGSYRIIYLIDDGHHKVTIFKIGHRKDVYR